MPDHRQPRRSDSNNENPSSIAAWIGFVNIQPEEPWREPSEPSTRFRDASGPRTAAEIRTGEEDEFGLSNLVQTLWMNKWTIFLTTAVCLGFAAWDMSRQTPLYTAASQVVLKTSQEHVIDLQGVSPQLSVDYGGINTEMRVLQSRELMSRVVDAMSLQNDPEFNPSLRLPPKGEDASGFDKLLRSIGLLAASPGPPRAPVQAREKAISTLLSSVSVSHVQDSYVFEIRAQTADPNKSADIANQVAEQYVDGQRAMKYKAMEDAMTWLSDRVVGLKDNVETAESKVEKFMASARLVSAETLTADALRHKAMRDLRMEQTEAAEQLHRRVERLQALRARADFATLAQEIDDPFMQRAARDLSSGVADQAGNSEFDIMFGALIGGLRSDAERAESQASEIEKAIANLTAGFDAQSEELVTQLVTLQQLKREAESARLIYESFLNRLKEISVQQGIQQADSRVLSMAGIPGGASYPQKRQSIVRGGFVGIVLGVILVFIQNALRNTIRTPEELESISGTTVIGVIPGDRVQRPGALLDSIISKPASRLAEAVRNLRMTIQLSNVDAAPQVIVITSSVPDEGKSILASALAATTAMSGKKVLLVDADLRLRILREYFKVETSAGLVSFLSGRTSFDETVRHDDRIGLDILFADEGKVTPVDLFQSKQFENFLAMARKRYDLVVFDTPPVLAVPDARVLSQYADAVIYVVRWNSTNRRMIQSGLALLRQVNVRVSGLALTRIDAKRMDLYGYYGYGDGGNRLQRYYEG
ncbi:MAG TPA: polysaccharide biosynthesis tyrosine autokinase [Hyphomicrobiaceae bacterium]|nr:polysaccharide biosynthesis tyrosine autokinase [Hyphomicrobiaceae bacterium]